MRLLRTAGACALVLCAEALAQSEVVDATGRTIRPPAQVARVYAAGPPASLMVYAIAPEKLIGWTRALRAREAAFFDARAAALPELGRLTGRGNTANVEVVLRARPDLIVDAGFIAGSYVSLAERVQAQTGIGYALFDGRLDATPAALRALGRLTGDAATADALADWFEGELADIRARVARLAPGDRPRVYYGRGTAGLQTGGRGSINVEVLELLGADNVAAEARAGLVTVSPEQVLLWNPEVILTTDPNFWQRAWHDPLWRAVDAVAQRRLYLSPHLPFGWFDFPPGPNRLLGAWWAGRLLYPQAFADVDLEGKVVEFHRRFYHRAPSAAQLAALLGEPGVMPPR
ncbi:MAG: ABC transporter substrate-binding protein [Burkholderiales bacterium]|nr:ABC transporter substrate-binding protein [Burkholderiales bacterium]